MGADSRSLKAMEKEEEQAFQRGESAEAEGGPVRPAIAISGKEVEALLGRLFEQLRQKSCGGSVGATSSTTAPISDVGVERMVMESLDYIMRVREGNVEQTSPAHGRIANGEREMTGGYDEGTRAGDGTEKEHGGTEG